MANYQGSGTDLTISEFTKMILTIKPSISEDTVKQKYSLLSKNTVMIRAEVAVLIDEILNPFDTSIDWFGNIK
jgi:hypothetical protein